MTKTGINKKQLRNFGLFIGITIPLLFGWIIPLISGHGFRPWSIWIGMPTFFIGLIAPNLLRYPYKAWIALGNFLGMINSYIILGIVFVIILQPIAFIMKAFGYDPLRRRRRSVVSYRENCETHKTDLKRIF